MTLIDPESYINSLSGCTYEELIQERERLMRFVLEFEIRKKKGKKAKKEQDLDVDPEMIYKMYLRYLSKLFKLMEKKYRKKSLKKEEKKKEAEAAPKSNLPWNH